jgi:hypothetical protein
MQFTPLQDFFCEELRSQYCVGLSYTVRPKPADPDIPGDKETPKEQTVLGKLLPKWIAEGKVRLGAPDVPATITVAGTGKVK